MTGLRSIAVLSVALACFAVSQARADRKPTLEERSRIETKLKELGYSKWDDIELDEERNVWEVDDARLADGTEYDLKLNPQTLEVTSMMTRSVVRPGIRTRIAIRKVPRHAE